MTKLPVKVPRRRWLTSSWMPWHLDFGYKRSELGPTKKPPGGCLKGLLKRDQNPRKFESTSGRPRLWCLWLPGLLKRFYKALRVALKVIFRFLQRVPKRVPEGLAIFVFLFSTMEVSSGSLGGELHRHRGAAP